MRRARVLASAAAVAALAAFTALVIVAVSHHPGHAVAAKGTRGYDVSWPQCSGSSAGTMPQGLPSYVILGLTHGVGHSENPCLGSQLGWARDRGVRVGGYLVASYPTRAQLRASDDGLYGVCGASTMCRLRNDGAAQAADAVASMQRVGLHTPLLWIDVELGHTPPWSHQNVRNAAVVAGIVRGLSAANVPTGVYTTPTMWQDIVGSYRLDVPNWLPSGDNKERHAMALCNATATGGQTWLVQYTSGLDHDETCPALAAVPGHVGRLWPYRLTTQRLGSRGPAVSAVQQFLGQPQTGVFGPATASQVGLWQQTLQLPVTGRVTPTDWHAMGAWRRYGGRPFELAKIAQLT